MSQPSVSDIATAIGKALGTAGIRYIEYLSDTVTPPVALVGIDTIDYHGAFAFADVQHDFTVFLILPRASDRAGIALMESYMSQAGTTSVRAAIEADQTLGGVVSSLKVTKSGPPSAISVGGTEYLSVPFAVEVHA